MAIGIVASSYMVPHIANKAAVWPGDVFPADPAMPAFATSAYYKTQQLNGSHLGYYPDPAFMDTWSQSYAMTYDGALYYWSGTQWAQGAGPSLTVSMPGLVSYLYSDMSRLPKSKRLAALSRHFTPSPSTPWDSRQYSWCMGQAVFRWNGTAWEIVQEAPEFPAEHPLTSKVMTLGSMMAADPLITAQDATEAAELTTRGFTSTADIVVKGSNGEVGFPSTTSTTSYRFYRNGSVWGYSPPSGNVFAGMNVADSYISALPANLQGWGAGCAYTAQGNGPWSPTTYVTIGGIQFWCPVTPILLPGVAPGVAPPVPNKNAIMPYDQMVTPDPELPSFTHMSYSSDAAYFVQARRYRVHPSENLAWRAANGDKFWTYLNCRVIWNGTHWFNAALYSTKTTLDPTSSSVSYSLSGAAPALGVLPTTAEQIAVANSYYKATAVPGVWAADQMIFCGNVILQWNGTGYTVLCETPRIQEAATYPVFPGDMFMDSRVLDTSAASSLLGYGYVPVLRHPWKVGTGMPLANRLTFYHPTNAAGAGGVMIQFSWNGTTWVGGSASTANTTVAPGAVVTDAIISALPAAQRVVACTLAGYIGNPSTAHWTTGQSATIGGTVVHWHGTGTRYWAPGAAP